MRNGQLEEDEWKRLKEAIERISDAPVYIDDTPGINIFELRAKCRRMKLQYNIQLIIIDYLQLMSGGGEAGKGNREQEVSAISRALKGLAKELSVPVIALSQLSRAVETRGGSKRPQLSDLRESGCLTGDARLQDAHTGQFYTIKDLAERPEQEPIWVVSMDKNYQLKPFKLLRAFSSGQKQVFELVTRTGRKIKASANHPFLKFEGWAPLENLKVGDRIAVPDLINEITDNPALENPIPKNTIWDEILAINSLEVEEVYDATIEESHNFVANDIIVHNSIEQDADMVTFIYRPEYYQILEDEQGQSLKGIAEIIIAKNRHGAQDTVRLKFTGEFARFSNLDDPDFGSFPSDVFTNALPNTIITMPSRFNDEEDIPF
jgi:replicative DNA helicase